MLKVVMISSMFKSGNVGRIVKYCFKSNDSDRHLEILDRQIIIRNTVQSPLKLT